MNAILVPFDVWLLNQLSNPSLPQPQQSLPTCTASEFLHTRAEVRGGGVGVSASHNFCTVTPVTAVSEAEYSQSILLVTLQVYQH